MIYRLYIAGYEQTEPNAAMTIDVTPASSFLFAPENPDYQAFKVNVLAGAELQDADGNVMTQEQADDFIKELP
jgi:hypothetical protein